MTSSDSELVFTPDGSPAAAPGESGGNVIVKRGLSADVARKLRTLAYKRLVLSYGEYPDLSVLKGLPIERMVVYGTNVDWDAICSLENLVSLEIQGDSKPRLSTQLLNRLFHLAAPYEPNLERCLTASKSIRALRIDGSIQSIDRLHGFPNIEWMSIVKSGSLQDLEGLGKLSKLKFAEFSHCTKLAQASDLGACKKLEHLSFYSCKKLTDICGAARAPKLRELNLEIGEVDSLACLEGAKAIERLRFNCKVTDGNLDFLFRMLALQFCAFQSAKNFNRKIVEVQSYLASKGFDQAKLKAHILSFPSAREFVTK